MPTLPEAATNLKDLANDLLELRLRIETLERGFGVEPPRPMPVSARPDASVLRARVFGHRAANKGD